MPRRFLLITLSVTMLALIVLSLRPVPKATSQNSETITGQIDTVWGSGYKDINIQLVNDERVYYINRGAENGLSVQEFKENLLGKIATLKYVRHWTPLDPMSRYEHVTELMYGNEKIYSELD